MERKGGKCGTERREKRKVEMWQKERKEKDRGGDEGKKLRGGEGGR